MANKVTTDKSTTQVSVPNAFAELQEAGFGNMAGMSAAWIETMGDISAEVVSFVAERIKEDVKTQHEILHCKNITDLQHIQAQFLHKAVEQYRAETGKLVEMSSEVFARNAAKRT